MKSVHKNENYKKIIHTSKILYIIKRRQIFVFWTHFQLQVYITCMLYSSFVNHCNSSRKISCLIKRERSEGQHIMHLAHGKAEALKSFKTKLFNQIEQKTA